MLSKKSGLFVHVFLKKKGQFNNCPFTNVNPQTHIVLNAR